MESVIKEGICLLCGKQFIKKRNTKLYCSRYCVKKSNNIKNKEKNSLFKKKYVENNRELINNKRVIYNLNNKDKIRNNRLLKEYGITLAQYYLLLEGQNNRCKICTDILILPHVDHCHETGKVRGLLCVKCNMGIGSFNDNIQKLYSAINYLVLNK